jgi:hypothetical protein
MAIFSLKAFENAKKIFLHNINLKKFHLKHANNEECLATWFILSISRKLLKAVHDAKMFFNNSSINFTNIFVSAFLCKKQHWLNLVG